MTLLAPLDSTHDGALADISHRLDGLRDIALAHNAPHFLRRGLHNLHDVIEQARTDLADRTGPEAVADRLRPYLFVQLAARELTVETHILRHDQQGKPRPFVHCGHRAHPAALIRPRRSARVPLCGPCAAEVLGELIAPEIPETTAC